ncbi:MAG: hypothetical protein QM775_03675 [Pirellulales bacterium]
MRTIVRRAVLVVVASFCVASASAGELSTSIRQITFGPRHHFYGYIGHVGNTPWSGDGRHLVCLRTAFQDHMPKADEAAEIVLLDARNGSREREIEQTRAWNFQQGTMLYWNPAAPNTQLFFNDRDPRTSDVFCVLLEVTDAGARRLVEYRREGVSFGNSGVAQSRRSLSGNQLRTSRPLAAGDRVSRGSRCDGRRPAASGRRRRVSRRREDENCAAIGLVSKAGRAAAAHAARRRRHGTLYQSHALESRRFANLLFRARQLRRRNCAGSTCRWS